MQSPHDAESCPTRACSPVRCECASRRELHAGLREKAVSWLRRAHGRGGGQPRGGQPQLQRAFLQRADAEQRVLKHNAPRCLTQASSCLQISNKNNLYRQPAMLAIADPSLAMLPARYVALMDEAAIDRQNLGTYALESDDHAF